MLYLLFFIYLVIRIVNVILFVGSVCGGKFLGNIDCHGISFLRVIEFCTLESDMVQLESQGFVGTDYLGITRIVC